MLTQEFRGKEIDHTFPPASALHDKDTVSLQELFYTFPLDIYLLVRIDLIRVEDLKKVRKELLVGMLIITAILTPDPTPVSMLLMTIPFFILYELTIIILGWIMKDKPDHVVEAGRQKSIELIAKNQQSKPEE